MLNSIAKPVTSYATKPKRVLKFYPRLQAPKTILTHFHYFKTTTSNILFFFLPSTKTNHSFPTKEGCGNKSSQNLSWKLCPEIKSSKWSKFALLKRRKKVKENPNSVANGKRRRRFPCLVANGRKRKRFPCLVSMEVEGEVIFHLFSFPPQQILLKPSFFPLILRFYFTMVLGCY